MIGLGTSVASGHVQDASTEYTLTSAFVVRVLTDGGTIESQSPVQADIKALSAIS